MDFYDILLAKKLAGNGGGGGGSASNLVTGTFKSTSAGVYTINVPYTGEGHMLSVIIAPTEGAFNKDGDFYKLIARYTFCTFCLYTPNPDIVPTYTNSSSKDQMQVLYTYKSSESTSYSLSNGGTDQIQVFNQNSPSGSGYFWCVNIPDNKTIKVYTCNPGDGKKGFVTNIDFTYVIQYSE